MSGEDMVPFWGVGLFVGERARRNRFGGDFGRIIMVVARSLSWLGGVGVLEGEGHFFRDVVEWC